MFFGFFLQMLSGALSDAPAGHPASLRAAALRTVRIFKKENPKTSNNLTTSINTVI
jgi:hypothetical protein